MRILLFGKSGQLGQSLIRVLQPNHDVSACGRQDVDLLDAASINDAVRTVRPEVIINAAAYTAVDRAEQEPELAEAVNARAPGVMARAAQDSRALLVHYSTDYVFDGCGREPYTEDHAPNPLSVYGATKLEGERAVMGSGADCLILRTSWVYARHGRNFPNTMLRLAQRGRAELRIVDDQHGAPTYAPDLAEATATILGRIPGGHRGLYHATAAGETTWCGFARRIFSAAGMQVRVEPIGTRDYPTAAQRPAYSVLSNEALRKTFGVSLPSWTDAVDRCFEPERTA